MRTEKKYTGYWNFNSETPTIAGTLTVGNDITIEIVEFNDKSYYTHLSIDGLKGVALDENNETFFFELYDLNFLQSHTSNMGVQSYTFSVSYLVFSKSIFFQRRNDKTLSVSEISICNPYLNGWCCSRTDIHNYEVIGKRIDYHFEQPSSFVLSELDDCKVSVFISNSAQLRPEKYFHNILQPFVNIIFNEPTELKDSFPIIRKIENLLSLFMNSPFVNENIQFNIGKIRCVCIQNIKIQHINYSSSFDGDARALSDIHDVMDNNIVRHWFELYKEEPHALSLFFNTINNEELADELLIICYASVLEELTKRYYAKEYSTTLTRKKKLLLHIIDILKNDHHLKEANDLKTSYLDKGDYFEFRLLNLLQMHQDLWELIEIEEFAKKAALTRNFLVHRQIPENQEPYLFQPKEYQKVAVTLRYIISATLLRELGFLCKDDIIRILCYIWPQAHKDEQYTWLKPPQYNQMC